MSDILNVLKDLKDRIEGQLKQFDSGMISIVDGSLQPLQANKRYHRMLRAQLTDVEDAICLVCDAAMQKPANVLN